VHVRTATVDDALAVETVRIRGWQTAYRGIVAASFLDSLVVDTERRVEMIGSSEVTTLVAEDDGIVGMAAYGPARDESQAGELYALYVDPASWRTGVGTALLAACEGVTVLWVLADNERAQAFYRRHGFEADGGSKVLDLDGPVREIRMRRG
jgi:ribosomal protein S18 acetylase RimI-like enzyme